MVPLYHYVAFTAALFPFVMSLIYFFKSIADESGRIHAAAGVSLCIALILGLWFARVFALKAQDRAIRSEENLRHFIATGKPLDSRLSLVQIVGLRFAGDDEFVALAKQAADENMSQKQIKMAVKHWKGDHERV